MRSYLIAYKSSYLCTLILKIKLEDKSAPFTGKPFTGKLRNTRQILKHKIKCSGTEIIIYKNLALSAALLLTGNNHAMFITLIDKLY